jgi:hypothetical protein
MQGKSREAVQQWLQNERSKANVTMSPELQALMAEVGRENLKNHVHTP